VFEAVRYFTATQHSCKLSLAKRVVRQCPQSDGIVTANEAGKEGETKLVEYGPGSIERPTAINQNPSEEAMNVTLSALMQRCKRRRSTIKACRPGVWNTHRWVGNACPGYSRFSPGINRLLQLFFERLDFRGELERLSPNMLGKPAGNPECCHRDLQEVINENGKPEQPQIAITMHLRVNTCSSGTSRNESARGII